MTKQAKFVFRVLLVLLLLVFATGCDIIQKEDAGQPTDFKRGEAGLVMGFLQNYPGNSYLVTDDADREKISVVIEIRNKGTYHPSEEKIPTFREYYVFKVPGEITDAELEKQ